jgi:hypothetical protein
MPFPFCKATRTSGSLRDGSRPIWIDAVNKPPETIRCSLAGSHLKVRMPRSQPHFRNLATPVFKQSHHGAGRTQPLHLRRLRTCACELSQAQVNEPFVAQIRLAQELGPKH